MGKKDNHFDLKTCSGLAGIQTAVKRLNLEKRPEGSITASELIDRGNRTIDAFEAWLLDDEQHLALNKMPTAKFILYAAAYLCDIGLTAGLRLPEAAGSRADLTEAVVFRSELNTLSAEMIRSDWQRYGLSNEEIAGAVAEVCRQTRGVFSSGAVERPTTSINLAGAEMPSELPAACLSLGRTLDLKSAATLCEIFACSSDGHSIEFTRLADSFSVEAVDSHPYLNGTIRIKIRCHDPEVHRALKHHERKVQQLLEDLNRRLRPRFLYSDVIYEIDPVGYEPMDLKFSIDSSAGLQLFMGNRLYADKRVFLRELIQNAVDACNYRKFIDADYGPAITIKFNEDMSAISIRDNGIGMSRQWIEKYFLAIGISFYQSDEIRNASRDARIDFGFISQFGIGFLSSFQVAEKIVIKTRKSSAPGLSITISSLKDYFDVRLIDEDYPAGTEVTLYLKQSEINYCRRLEFAGYLKTNIRFLNIPVTLEENGARKLTIGREKLAYSTDKRYGTMFVSALKLPESEGYVRLGAKDNGANIYALDSASGGVSIFQDGIFVTQLDDLLPEGARSYVVSRINLTGQDKCELSMDRNRMFWTADQLKNLKRVIRHGIVDVANQLMAEVQACEVSRNTLNSIVNHLAIFFDFSDFDDQMYKKLCVPVRNVVEKKFRDFVRINFAHTLKSSKIADADGYSEKWQQQVLDSFVKTG